MKCRTDEVCLKELVGMVRTPLRFVELVLGAKPSKQQSSVLKALEDGERRIAIRSGHGVGKSTLLAWVLLWWISTRPGAVIPCTAPTAHQLEDILWGEVVRWHKAMGEPLRSLLTVTKNSVRHKSAPQGWFAAARTSRRDNPEALQGFHGEHLAFLIDEASGVAEEVFEVAEGALSTPGALVILAGNPTRLDGTFYRAFHGEREHWATFHFPSHKSPLVSTEYAKHMAARYGESSDIYRVRVEGEFPLCEADTLIALPLVEAAIERAPHKKEVPPLVYGVDVARFGDDETVILKRRGDHVLSIEALRDLDTMAVAGLIAASARAEKPSLIFIDVIGVGAGVADRLLELGLPIYQVNVARRAAEPERFDDLRSELWWRTREWLESGAPSLPPDEELAAQLTTIKYSLTSNGRVRVESKQERKKRGLKSPDRGDALMMTFASPVSALPRIEAGREFHKPFDRELGY